MSRRSPRRATPRERVYSRPPAERTDNMQRLFSQGTRLVRQRNRWMDTPAGRERMRDVHDLAGETAAPVVEQERNNPLYSRGPQYTKGGYTRAQLWSAAGWTDDISAGISDRHNVHDDQRHIPGLEPDDVAHLHTIDSAAKRKAERWEDLSERDQDAILLSVRAKSGATIESMMDSYGAQLDQAMHRASRNDAAPLHFYGAGEPNEVIERTTSELVIPRGLTAALHADNSAQTPFVTGQGPNRRYPQDEMAREAVSLVRTDDPMSMTDDQLDARRPPGAMGYAANWRKSVRRAHQHLIQGTPVRDTNPNSTGSGFGPKTGPYQRAWVGGTSSQFVSDVHSGGGGFLPHRGYQKPVKLDADRKPVLNKEGQVVRLPSEREQGIATGGFHLLGDFVARQVPRERGLHIPVKRGQETQWVEEQIQRPDLPQTEQKIFGNAPHRDARRDVDMAQFPDVPSDVEWESEDWRDKDRRIAPATGEQETLF